MLMVLQKEFKLNGFSKELKIYGLSKRNAVTFLTHSSSIISESLSVRNFVQTSFDAAYQTLSIV